MNRLQFATILATIILCTITIHMSIEKHSVHPNYGNYKKVDFTGRKCQPWDACQ